MRHVDGLRAWAVSLVILYHLDFSFFQIGFLGVDIFFVISGFLMARIITESIENDEFSLPISPETPKAPIPNAFTVLLTTAASWFLPNPTHLATLENLFCLQVCYQTTFFFTSGGYF